MLRIIPGTTWLIFGLLMFGYPFFHSPELLREWVGNKKRAKDRMVMSLSLDYLCTELKVGDDDGNLRTWNHQNNEDQEKESKQIIIFLLPDGLKEKNSWTRNYMDWKDLTENIKNNSMNIAPNGRMPANNVQGTKFRYQGCSGTCRGIWLVRTGCS